MMRYGILTEGHVLDTDGSTVEYAVTYKEFNIKSEYKRFNHRVRVHNKKEEMVEYLTWTNAVDQARVRGSLVRGDNDPRHKPSFEIEYPKHDQDGSYFVIRSYTEIVHVP